MNYPEGKPIYLQIADSLCGSVLQKIIHPGDRIMSVREMAAKMMVNPNTIIRSYALLEEQGIISMQRGVGYFLTDNAYEQVLQIKRKEFMEKDVPQFFKSLKLLGIDLEELLREYPQG